MQRLFIQVTMKTDYSLSKQFQEDIINAYNRVAYVSWSQVEAYKKAVKQPAQRYYVTAKQAAQVISPMVRGDFSKVNAMKPNRRRLYYSLFERVVEMSERRQFCGKSLAYIMEFAVLSPAPEFFVTHYLLANMRSLIKHRHVDDDGKIHELPCRKRAYKKLKAKRLRKAQKLASVGIVREVLPTDSACQEGL